MGDKTKIQWTDASWNPIRAHNKKTLKTGWFCTHVSEGCRNCYSEAMNVFRGNGLAYKPGHLDDVTVYVCESTLKLPLQWTRPRMIFVCSMTDLFAEWHTDEMIDRVFDVMAIASQHKFQVLTKRADRMLRFVSTTRRRSNAGMCWPLPNVWLGVSVEDQDNANVRIPQLVRTPAAVRFISYEPALGPIDLTLDSISCYPCRNCDGGTMRNDPETGANDCRQCDGTGVGDEVALDWVIVGGESGKGARPFDLQWARDVIRQCKDERVACFVKQLGAQPYEAKLHCTPAETALRLRDAKGGNIDEWPDDLRVREYPA